MVMKDDDIIKNVLEYVKDERYRQAVLIDGEWGAGKTFFVKEKIVNEDEGRISRKKNLLYFFIRRIIFRTNYG